MDTPATKQDDNSTRFVEPSLRPAPEQPSPRRISIGVALLVLGFVGIVLGDAGVLGQVLLVSGNFCHRQPIRVPELPVSLTPSASAG